MLKTNSFCGERLLPVEWEVFQVLTPLFELARRVCVFLQFDQKLKERDRNMLSEIGHQCTIKEVKIIYLFAVFVGSFW